MEPIDPSEIHFSSYPLLAVPFSAIMLIVFQEFEGTRPVAVLLSRDGQLDEDGA